jgi:hypothetical protein
MQYADNIPVCISTLHHILLFIFPVSSLRSELGLEVTHAHTRSRCVKIYKYTCCVGVPEKHGYKYRSAVDVSFFSLIFRIIFFLPFCAQLP